MHKPSVLVVGAGTWGTSTALHLARRGYSSVTVLDRYPVPSPISAGNDVNKIIDLNRESGEDADERHVSRLLYDTVMRGWKEDVVFRDYCHETGMIIAASSPEGIEHVRNEEGTDGPEWTELKTKHDFQAAMPDGVLTGEFPGWRGWWKQANSGAGWVHARKAMQSAASAASSLGVVFLSGEAGDVVELIIEDSDVKGARTRDGQRHRAEKVVLCAGANAASLLDMQGQLLPKAWTLAHIRLSEEEIKLYKSLPVLFNCERGFFMEPDEDCRALKICDEHPGYCNWIMEDGGTEFKRDDGRRDEPFAKHQIPVEAEQRVRLFLRETMPQLAERPFSFARICWCADTPDRNFLIDRHPEYPSLTLGVGGSGHGYVYIPAIGSFIVDAVEGQLDARMQKQFRWRPETAVGRDWTALQGRYGPKGSCKVMDLHQVREWTNIYSSSPL
ncbi:uncharacterized protein HMPREF1541_10669 [Cyphellophora europaea CBS 101466]|uniref:FAD dependent oxidoreductase domain-containing protein n=1 Tax=Cyphellophora europaea (strain CBS 101466) TaxID=1220924 RepID=W2S858_CYPE1|nr:uncharacterized protein HMPREF1541_10669 [Cyphellophora europaea CBS 101466]ETN44119.1 hypothetical protein HMPREF1541_10669 [Cyphellophora europaea CBS 101466]